MHHAGPRAEPDVRRTPPRLSRPLMLSLSLRAFAGALVLSSSALAQVVPLPADSTETLLPPAAESPAAEPPAPPRPTVVARPAPVVGRARQRIGPRRLGGPRTGVTILSQATVDRINEAFDDCFGFEPTPRDNCDGPTVSSSFPVVTQFGWQFENRIFQAESGLTGLTEWVLLVGGVERGLFLPSLTFLAGIRAPNGMEIGVGPNISVGGAAYAVAVGVNNAVDDVNIPLNVAIVFGQDGPRASLLVGFNVSDRRY